jgi:hypothetical protein
MLINKCGAAVGMITGKRKLKYLEKTHTSATVSTTISRHRNHSEHYWVHCAPKSSQKLTLNSSTRTFLTEARLIPNELMKNVVFLLQYTFPSDGTKREAHDMQFNIKTSYLITIKS